VASQKKLDRVNSEVKVALTSQGVPLELQDALCDSAREMVHNYVGDQLRPSELNGGDFTEAAVRILQFLATGSCTPLGRSLPSMSALLKIMEQSSLDDSLRIHIPRLLQAMYDVRNRRGVSHLPGPVSANKPDAELLLVLARWTLAEFIRIYHGGSHVDAQRTVDLLAIHDSQFVVDFEGVFRIVAKKLPSAPDQILILLRASEGQAVTKGDLEKWVRSTKNAISTGLTRLDQRNLIHVHADGRIVLTPLGRDEADIALSKLETS